MPVPYTMGIVPTDIIFAGSTFLLYSYSSKNFQANWVNKTNATGSALSHTICPKGFGWPSLLGKIFFWSKSESWHGLILLSITQIFLLSAAQLIDGVRIPQAAEHFFAFSFHKNWCLIVMNWTEIDLIEIYKSWHKKEKKSSSDLAWTWYLEVWSWLLYQLSYRGKEIWPKIF